MCVKIDNQKLDLALARRCLNMRDLRREKNVSQQTLTRIRHGEEVLPKTVGCIAMALGVDPEEIVEANN